MAAARILLCVLIVCCAMRADAQHAPHVEISAALNYVALQVNANLPPGPLRLSGTITYQICDDKACFQPEDTPFEVQTKLVGIGESPAPNQPELFKNFDPSVFSNLGRSSESAAPRVVIFGRNLDEASWVFIFAAAFVIGMIFNVMPCVLPVV